MLKMAVICGKVQSVAEGMKDLEAVRELGDQWPWIISQRIEYDLIAQQHHNLRYRLAILMEQV